MALADFQQLVKRMVPNEGEALTDLDYDGAVDVAVLRYGADAPRELVRDVGWLVTGFLGPLPAEWMPGSALRGAEFPIGLNPPAQIPLATYVDEGGALLMAEQELSAGAEVRISFSTPHRLDGATDTIPLAHREAVASYAAYTLCRQLSARYSAERESSVSADGSNTESRARNYAARANEYRAAYYAGIGKANPYAQAGASSTSAVQPAASVGSWPGRRRFGLTQGGDL
jgi:hypothetical protein